MEGSLMSETSVDQPRWSEFSRMPLGQKITSLAVLLSPYSDPETGKFKTPPVTHLKRDIFPRQGMDGGPAAHTIGLLRKAGVLTNADTRGGKGGDWTLHLPAGIERCGDAVSAARQAAVLREADACIRHLGAENVPALIVALKTRAGL